MSFVLLHRRHYHRSRHCLSRNQKFWGVYVVVLEKPDVHTLVYTHSRTNRQQGIKRRLRDYANPRANISLRVTKASQRSFQIVYVEGLFIIAQPLTA